MAKTHQERLEMLETLWKVAYDLNDVDGVNTDPHDVWNELKQLLAATGWELDAIRIDGSALGTSRAQELAAEAIRMADEDADREEAAAADRDRVN